MVGVQIWFVAYLQTNEVLTEDSLSHLGDLKPEVRGIIERNTCSAQVRQPREKKTKERNAHQGTI